MPPREDQHVTQERIRKLRQKATEFGIADDEFKLLFSTDLTKTDYSKFKRALKNRILFKTFLTYSKSQCQHLLSKKFVFTFLLLIVGYALSPELNSDTLKILRYKATKARCLFHWMGFSSLLFRPHMPCGICANLRHVPIVYNISVKEFTKYHAYTAVPVLIKGAIQDWEALQSFNFQYFKRLYSDSNGSVEFIHRNCWYYPYLSEFGNLSDVFQMPDDRAALKNDTKPWYIGWSDCGSDASSILRTQYSRPYFLPKDSNDMPTDWIFMGGPGYGAHVHIDSVERPSWQAQISGSKTWLLVPSPECSNQCHKLEVTVEKGDIFVIDTNVWFHSTKINSGNISITIGAEYD